MVSKIQSYAVFSLDVWGHCSVDCKEHGCDCIGEDGEHDDDACQCFFDVNNSFRAGKIEVSGIEKKYNQGTVREFASLEILDEDIVSALIENGFLKERVTSKDITIDDCGMVSCSRTGEPLYYIEAKEEEESFKDEALTPFFV